MPAANKPPRWRSTTIVSVRKGDTVALGGDGQVTFGNTIMKADTRKIRWMLDKKVLVGFAGSTADAFALMERFETKLKDFPGNLPRAATELALTSGRIRLPFIARPQPQTMPETCAIAARRASA